MEETFQPDAHESFPGKRQSSRFGIKGNIEGTQKQFLDLNPDETTAEMMLALVLASYALLVSGGPENRGQREEITTLSACLAKISSDQGPPNADGQPPCIPNCLQSATACDEVKKFQEVKDLKKKVKDVIAKCIPEKGCSETPINTENRGQRGEGRRGNGGWKEFFQQFKAALPPAARSCFDTCPNPWGRRGDRSKRGAGGEHWCLKKFCSCDVVKGCMEEAKVHTDKIREIMQTGCNCMVKNATLCASAPGAPPACPAGTTKRSVDASDWSFDSWLEFYASD